MYLTKSLGRLISAIAIAAGGAAVIELAKPGVLPELLPPEYAAAVAIGLKIVQAVITDKAFDRNWDGSSASEPAPPQPTGDEHF